MALQTPLSSHNLTHVSATGRRSVLTPPQVLRDVTHAVLSSHLELSVAGLPASLRLTSAEIMGIVFILATPSSLQVGPWPSRTSCYRTTCFESTSSARCIFASPSGTFPITAGTSCCQNLLANLVLRSRYTAYLPHILVFYSLSTVSPLAGLLPGASVSSSTSTYAPLTPPTSAAAPTKMAPPTRYGRPIQPPPQPIPTLNR